MGDDGDEEEEDDDDEDDLSIADANYNRSSRTQPGCPTLKPMFQKRVRGCSCCMLTTVLLKLETTVSPRQTRKKISALLRQRYIAEE
jgi:hypothetical protein